MSLEIFFCAACKLFTLKTSCPTCQGQVFSPRPPRFSPLDKWGKWRRLAKKEQENSST
ncbi:MAG TPA: RNA-protein complex protein Nop10 [Candidatus Nanoarchaeia archaeon]|nr:RNA-protein complex protein Nop10 [Candidatus Nanoarchaeia archaeon]